MTDGGAATAGLTSQAGWAADLGQKPQLRGVLHQVAFALSLVTGTALVVLAPAGQARLAAAVYAVSVSLLFGTSAAYHRGPWSARARARMRRLDHSMIFVLIAGTFTPFALLVLPDTARWLVLAVAWGGALVGIASHTVLQHQSRWLTTSLYLALGALALPVLPGLLRGAGSTVVLLIVLGGALYVVGAVVYARQRPNPWPHWFGFHEVFHALTVLAYLSFYAAVSLATSTATLA